MKRQEEKKYKLHYSLYKHNIFGYVIEPYAVQVNDEGQPTLNHVRVYSHTMDSYLSEYDNTDVSLIKIMDDYSLEALRKKFASRKKKIGRPAEFLENLDEEKLTNYIRPFIKRILNKVLYNLVGKKTLYLKGHTDNPLQEKLVLPESAASVFFHFKKHEEGLTYYPTIKHNGQLVYFRDYQSELICYEPCWFLVGNHLYHFEQAVEGKKLEPFIKKPRIQVPIKHEETYFNKFVLPLIEKYPVVTHGFPVEELSLEPSAMLKLGTSLINGKWCLFLVFKYRSGEFYQDSESMRFARLGEETDPEKREYKVELIYRNFHDEEKYVKKLKKYGLEKGKTSAWFLEEAQGFEDYLEWVNNNYKALKDDGFDTHLSEVEKEYFMGNTELDFQINDKKDWFDINAIVRYGSHEIPFYKLRDHILNDIREFKLPDGKIAILPKEWFSEYKELFVFGDVEEKNEKIRLKKYHYKLLSRLPGMDNGKRSKLYKQLSEIDEQEASGEVLPPENLKADLRTYQVQGLNWLYGLRRAGLGGCLADDMGLGKTIQTLSVLTKMKEEYLSSNESFPPSIIIMPASLIHNWINEIRKFTPKVSHFAYIGSDRKENRHMIPRVDVVFTTYGTIRNDIEELEDYIFSYIILDESQTIKNPESKVAKAVKRLNGHNRLVLTGTPIENTLTDLWSQMNFVNPGLLGGYTFFKNQYAVPIEKKNNEEARQNLKKLINPFILRRTKEQVATELPTLTQKTHYCEMTEEQEKEYEKIKSSYRNQIFKNIEKHGIKKSQFMILRGLTQLRLLANHPRLIKPDSDATSGKFDEVLTMLENIMENNHKILIYSQFVKHLNIFKTHFDKTGINYSYFAGSTTNREEVLDEFINNEEKQVILISLKAGGAGLNLMAADYVFLLDPWWNPAVEQQAINRAHRIGQDKKVFSYRFITRNTIEEKIMRLQDKKANLSQDFITPTKGLGGNLDLEDVRTLLQ